MRMLIVFIVMLSWGPLCTAQVLPVMAAEQVHVLADPYISNALTGSVRNQSVAPQAPFHVGPSANESTSRSQISSGINPPRLVAKVVGALGLVLLVIFGIAVIAKRAGFSSLKRSKTLVLRESLTVGAKERLVVVDFAGESLLIGVASGKVSLVKSVPLLGFDSSELPAPHLGAKTATDFQEKLNEFLLKGQK